MTQPEEVNIGSLCQHTKTYEKCILVAGQDALADQIRIKTICAGCGCTIKTVCRFLNNELFRGTL